MNRAQQPRPNVPNNTHNVASAPVNVAPSNKKSTPASTDSKWVRYATVALLFSITILLVSVVAYIGFRGESNEFKYVNKNEYQAVFVNVTGTSGGQVYFGHIQSITDKYVDLTNVFYIQGQSSSSTGSQSSSQSSYTLVKLGCELHAPEDQMILNHDQVFFWENLKNSGQVATKIADYYKANPNGTTCNSSSTSSSSSSSSSNTSQTGSSTQSSTSSTSGKSTSSTSTSGQ